MKTTSRKKASKTKISRQNTSTTPRADTKRLEIIVAAAAVFAEHGYANTTMNMIAKRLDWHTAGLYYYFENKDALVEALLRYTSHRLANEANKALDELGDAAPLDRVKTMIRSHAMTVMRGDSVGTAYQKIYKQVSPELQAHTLDAPRAFARLWQGVIDEAVESGDLRGDISARLLRLLLLGSIAWIPDWFKPKGPNSPEEISDALVALFLEGARARPDTTRP